MEHDSPSARPFCWCPSFFCSRAAIRSCWKAWNGEPRLRTCPPVPRKTTAKKSSPKTSVCSTPAANRGGRLSPSLRTRPPPKRRCAAAAPTWFRMTPLRPAAKTERSGIPATAGSTSASKSATKFGWPRTSTSVKRLPRTNSKPMLPRFSRRSTVSTTTRRIARNTVASTNGPRRWDFARNTALKIKMREKSSKRPDIGASVLQDGMCRRKRNGRLWSNSCNRQRKTMPGKR